VFCVAVTLFILLSSGLYQVSVGIGTPSDTHVNVTVWPIQDLEADVVASFIVGGTEKLNKIHYYMASSVSRQGQQILCCNWLRESARWCYLARSGFCAVSRTMFWCSLSHIINPLLTKLVRSRWLDIGLILFFCLFMVLVNKHTKKNLAN